MTPKRDDAKAFLREFVRELRLSREQFADVDAMRGEELALRVVVFGGEALNLSGLSGWVERHTDDAPALVLLRLTPKGE